MPICGEKQSRNWGKGLKDWGSAGSTEQGFGMGSEEQTLWVPTASLFWHSKQSGEELDYFYSDRKGIGKPGRKEDEEYFCLPMYSFI